MLLEYACISTLLCAAYVTYVLYSEETLFGIVVHLLYRRLPLFLCGNAALAVVALLLSSLLNFTLGSIRELEAQSISEFARSILVDTVLFLLITNPTVHGRDVPHSILVTALCVTIATKVIHLLSNGRIGHAAEPGGRDWQVLRRLGALFVALTVWDAFIIGILLPRASRKSTFYAWLVFEFSGFLVAALQNVAKLLIIFVDFALESRAREGPMSRMLRTPRSSPDPLQSPSVSPSSQTQDLASPSSWMDDWIGDLQSWPYKTEQFFVIETIKEVCDLLIYFGFLAVFCVSNPTRLPLYLATDLLQLTRGLYIRISSFAQYRRLLKILDTEFESPSPEKLAEDDTCIICRDVLTPDSKVLPCGHILHAQCLKSWFMTHQSCPTCRADISAVFTKSATRAAEAAAEVADGGAEPGSPVAAADERLKVFEYPGEKIKGKISILPPSLTSDAETLATVQQELAEIVQQVNALRQTR